MPKFWRRSWHESGSKPRFPSTCQISCNSDTVTPMAPYWHPPLILHCDFLHSCCSRKACAICSTSNLIKLLGWFLSWRLVSLLWENVLSGAGRKRLVYATNQELPRQTFNEEAVHSITQDYKSNKTKIWATRIRSKALTWRNRTNASFPLTNIALPRSWSHRGVILRRHPCNQHWGLFWFLFLVWLVISPKFRFQNFNGFRLFFGYQSIHIGIGFVDLYGFFFFFSFFILVFSWVLVRFLSDMPPTSLFYLWFILAFFLKEQFQKKGKLSKDGLQPLHKNQ